MKAKVFICLNEINNWAFFSASSLVIGFSSSSSSPARVSVSVEFPPLVVSWVISVVSAVLVSVLLVSSERFSLVSVVGSFSLSSFSIPSVVMAWVWNAGKTNSSTPPTMTEVCSRINGSSKTFPSISHLIFTLDPIILSIVHIINTPLGKVKGIVKTWPFFKLSFFSILIVISKVPSFSTLSNLNSGFSTRGGIVVTADKLGKRPKAIASSVNFGFNKVLLLGRPATNSEGIAIWIESNPVNVLLTNTHLKGAAPIFASVSNSTASSTVHMHSCFFGSLKGPFIR